MNLLFKIWLFFQIDPQIYFIEQLHPFRLNSKEIESNLLTKNKIERSGTRLEKAPQMDDDFKVHKKILIKSSHFKKYTFYIP